MVDSIKVGSDRVEFLTDNLTVPVMISCLFNQDLASRWVIKVEILSERSFKVSIRNNVMRLFGRKKIVKEREEIVNLIGVSQEYVDSEYKEDAQSAQYVPVLYSVGNPPLETWIRNGAVRTFLFKEPDFYIPVYVLAVSTSWVSKYPHSLKDKKSIPDMSTIDPQIRPLVRQVNRIPNVWTTYSCQGHIFRPPREPFVSFFSASFDRVLILFEIVKTTRTNFKWIIEGVVYPYRIQWKLTTKQKRTIFNTGEINEDISAISHSIDNLCQKSHGFSLGFESKAPEFNLHNGLQAREVLS